MANVHLLRMLIGAVGGVLISAPVVIMVGAVWGAIVRAAPCYGGASNYSDADLVIFGALFGMMAFAAFFVLPVAIVCGFIGAIVTGLHPKARAILNPKIITFLYPKKKSPPPPGNQTRPFPLGNKSTLLDILPPSLKSLVDKVRRKGKPRQASAAMKPEHGNRHSPKPNSNHSNQLNG
jgi:hypothetical protein